MNWKAKDFLLGCTDKKANDSPQRSQSLAGQDLIHSSQVMPTLRLAYRDNDRTPVIFCIKEMARRHYDLDVEILHIQPTDEYEAALFDDACDVIIEHTEYLFGEPIRGKNITFFCAPSIRTESHLVARSDVARVDQLAGGTVAIRSSGRPHASI